MSQSSKLSRKSSKIKFKLLNQAKLFNQIYLLKLPRLQPLSFHLSIILREQPKRWSSLVHLR